MRFTGARGVLQVHPTRRCNLTCIHCYSDSGPQARDEIPLSEPGAPSVVNGYEPLARAALGSAEVGEEHAAPSL